MSNNRSLSPQIRQIKHNFFTTLKNEKYGKNTRLFNCLRVSDYDKEVFIQFYLKKGYG